MVDTRTTEKMNLEEIGRYFENKNYQVIKLEQIWRHVTGVVKFENEKLFLKLATTREIGIETMNEKAWNENFNNFWVKQISGFRAPKIFDEGSYGDKYWFVSENVYGKPLVEMDKRKWEISESDLKKVAMIARNILDLTDKILLPKDLESAGEAWKNKLPEMSRQRAGLTKTNTKSLVKYIETESKNVLVGACHGDFVPWHIFKTDKNGYYLIDAEHSRIAGLRYYDVAYFYHRVYTKLKLPDLANYFLGYFKEISRWTEDEEKAFRVVLASRILGGYFDAERDAVTSMELNKEMEKSY